MSDAHIDAPNGAIGNESGNGGDGRNAFVNPGDIVIDTDGAGTGTGTGAGRTRRRGRPAGSTNKAKAAASIEGIEKILVSVHAIAAGFLKIPELAIDAEEGKLIANASAEVAKHYNVLPDEKTQAWVNLFMALGAVYGPRAFVIYQKKHTPKQENTVYTFPTANLGGTA